MEDIKRNREIRKQNALDRLDTDHPCCRICGEARWQCLELHHLAGKGFGNDQVYVCRNCHRILTNEQKDHPEKSTKGHPDFLERLSHLLMGLGDFFALLAEQLKKFGQELASYITAPPPAKNAEV